MDAAARQPFSPVYGAVIFMAIGIAMLIMNRRFARAIVKGSQKPLFGPVPSERFIRIALFVFALILIAYGASKLVALH